MPNYVANIVTFDGDKERIKEMLSAIQNDEFGPGSISFQKLIPMPPELDIECGSRTTQGIKAYRNFMAQHSTDVSAEDAYLQAHPDVNRETFRLGKQAYSNTSQYGAPTWYEWCNKHWGTKWDAYGYDEGKDYSQTSDLRFMTAWEEPRPVLQKLSEQYPGIEITHQWANEDYSMGCGTAVYKAGEQTELAIINDFEQAASFSDGLWDAFNSAGQQPEMEQQF